VSAAVSARPASVVSGQPAVGLNDPDDQQDGEDEPDETGQYSHKDAHKAGV
jgi:hypothetical protein